MEILLRRYNNETYVWKKAKFVNGSIKVDGESFHENRIVSIRNDIRKNYVRCSQCNTYFKKGSSKIEKHKELITDSHLCFGCDYLRQSVKLQKSQKYELLENGNYLSRSKSEVFLHCAATYYKDINSQEAREACKYNRCRNATMQPATGFFIDYPGAFDDMITINKVIDYGYKSASFSNYDQLTNYRLKGRYNLEAVVNNLNIVESFSLSYRNHYWQIYYSKKYNEFFVLHGNTYKKWNPLYDMNSETATKIKEIITTLYN